jgi:dephospho-CoA kinase
MLLLGLTGSIATGKSTVSQILSSPPYSLTVVDNDVIARQVVEPGTPGYKAIVDHFAGSVPDLLLPADDPACGGREDGPDGEGRPLNRPALGRAVFGASEEHVKARKVLNGIVHPAVRRAVWKQVVRPGSKRG